MMKHVFLFLLLLDLSVFSAQTHNRQKRLLPNNQLCDPFKRTCQKGDFVDSALADCQFQRTTSHPLSCSAKGGGGIISWVVAPDENNLCKPESKGVKFVCGAHGTNTRCVCSDYKVQWNRCRCQYWTESTPGEDAPGFCTAHYLGGDSKVHHYACCNNCNSTATLVKPPCDEHTYQGGSTGHYCGPCGKSLGGGALKWYFNCVNCSIQELCRKRCDKLVSTIAGLCWKWVNCFKGCCLKISEDKMSSRFIDSFNEEERFDGFCGDTICMSDQGETVQSCPSDCCFKRNNSTCSHGGTSCSPLCCLEESCCS